MKTIANFKRKMKVGSTWKTTRGFKDEPTSPPTIRKCSVAQTNSFAFATETPNGLRNSWCDFPKKKDVTFLDENTIKIENSFGYLIYEFIKPAQSTN